MSDMVKARECFDKAKAKRRRAMELFDEADELDAQGYKLTFRAPSVRRVQNVKTYLTEEIRDEVHDLSKDRTLSMHDIARRVGLRNGGRVSEILTGKR